MLTRVLDSVEEMQIVKLEITYLSAFVMPALLEIHFQVVRGQLKDQLKLSNRATLLLAEEMRNVLKMAMQQLVSVLKIILEILTLNVNQNVSQMLSVQLTRPASTNTAEILVLEYVDSILNVMSPTMFQTANVSMDSLEMLSQIVRGKPPEPHQQKWLIHAIHHHVDQMLCAMQEAEQPHANVLKDTLEIHM